MKIDVLTEKDQASQQFEDLEWPIADKAHYGKPFDGNKKTRHYLKASNDQGEVLGILNLEIQLGVAEVKDILVAHDLHSRGIGKELMGKAEQIAKQEHAHKMFLSTGANWEARHFYESLGYVVTGGQKDHHLHHDYVDYAKYL